MTDPLPIKAPRRLQARGINVGQVGEFVVVRIILDGGDFADVGLNAEESAAVATRILANREKLVAAENTKAGPRLYLPGPM